MSGQLPAAAACIPLPAPCFLHPAACTPHSLRTVGGRSVTRQVLAGSAISHHTRQCFSSQARGVDPPLPLPEQGTGSFPCTSLSSSLSVSSLSHFQEQFEKHWVLTKLRGPNTQPLHTKLDVAAGSAHATGRSCPFHAAAGSAALLRSVTSLRANRVILFCCVLGLLQRAAAGCVGNQGDFCKPEQALLAVPVAHREPGGSSVPAGGLGMFPSL